MFSIFDVMANLAQPVLKLPTKKGQIDRHIIKRYVKDGREYYLHATKGWRSRRL